MTAVDHAKRAFLRGDIRQQHQRNRLPWMVASFTDLCRRCDDCIEACEEDILIRGDGGYPTVDFQRGGCSFCADCVTACDDNALLNSGQPAWHLTVTIGDTCLDTRGITCRACGDACDERAIRFQLKVGGIALPVLDPNLCNGCGSCIAVCPIHIIQIQEAA